jgi:uncharacterized protein (TIGR00255 family)
MTVKSMTGFARVDGADSSANWYWELRSVNGRGLDVRMRLPPGAERVEIPARKLVAERLARGNVSVHLNQRRTDGSSSIAVNEEALSQVLALSEALRDRIGAPAPTVEGVLALRGVLETVEAEESEEAVAARAAAQLDDLARGLEALIGAREDEGRRLGEIVEDLLGRIAETVEAVATSPARSPEAITVRLGEQVARLLDDRSGNFDEARLHQEAVLLAMKADVEEELQRLRVHIGAARDLLSSGGAIGRRLDFLTQEFNREANTLCSKSNDSGVTQLGLGLKSTIEQMREQVQNIE